MSEEPAARAVALVERLFALLHECRALIPQLEAAGTEPESVSAQAERLLYYALVGAVEAGLVRTAEDALTVAAAREPAAGADGRGVAAAAGAGSVRRAIWQRDQEIWALLEAGAHEVGKGGPLMRRRRMLADLLLTLAAPFAAEAQQASKAYKIGYLGAFAFASQAGQPLLKSFLQGFNDLGYVEGRDFIMEYRWADGHADRLPALAAELVRAQVDVMVTPGTPATMAAKQATQTIPIVFPVLAAAVERGIVDSLARPGGNVTGLTTQTSTLKLYHLLKEAAPTVERVVYLYDPGSGGRGGAERLRTLEARAQALNVKWQSVGMRDPPDVVQAFAEFERGTNGLVLDFSSPLLLRGPSL